MKNVYFLILFFLHFCDINCQSFAEKEVLAMCDLCEPELIEIADINGDGFDDMIVYTSYNQEIVWFDNIESSEIGPPMFLISVNDNIFDMVVGDFDLDGEIDIVLGSDAGLSYYLNRGDVNLLLFSNDDQVINIRTIIATDINGDGLLDLAVRGSDNDQSPGDNILGILVNSSIFPFNFDMQETIVCSYAFFNSNSLVTGDMDRDGDLDFILTCNQYLDQVTIVENTNSDEFVSILHNSEEVLFTDETNIIDSSFADD